MATTPAPLSPPRLRSLARKIEFHLDWVHGAMKALRDRTETGDPLATVFYDVLLKEEIGVKVDVSALADEVIESFECLIVPETVENKSEEAPVTPPQAPRKASSKPYRPPLNHRSTQYTP